MVSFAQRRQENLEACDRPLRTISDRLSASPETARIAWLTCTASVGSHTNNAASPTTSGIEEVLALMTGVPHAMASRAVSPKPSYSDRKTNAVAP